MEWTQNSFCFKDFLFCQRGNFRGLRGRGELSNAFSHVVTLILRLTESSTKRLQILLLCLFFLRIFILCMISSFSWLYHIYALVDSNCVGTFILLLHLCWVRKYIVCSLGKKGALGTKVIVVIEQILSTPI